MKHGMGAEDDQAPELAIPLETLCFIIMKARQFDAKEAATEPDPGSNPTDDENAAILQDQADDPVQEELTSLISDLSDDEQIDLVTSCGSGGMTMDLATGRACARKLSTPTISIRPSISPASRC